MAYRTEIEKLEQRYAENPKQWFAALADAYRKQGDVDLAIEYVKGGIEDRPNYASAHIVLGRCYLDKNMDDDAARAFEQVLELDAENIVALKSLEEIAEKKGDVGGAQQWLRQLLEVDPMNEEAHESLARLEAAEQPPEPAPEAEEAARALPAEALVAEAAESAPAEMLVDPTPLDLTVAEETLDVSSVVDIEPIVLDARMPMDEESAASIEPFELETYESDASSFAAIEPFEIETDESDSSSLAAIVPFELESVESDASSLLADMAEGAGSWVENEEPVAAIEPIELDTPGAGSSSWFSDFPDEAEPVAAFEETTNEIEPLEIDDGAHHRASVPPTKEVEAVDLAAMRAADEMVARPTLDAPIIDDVEKVAPVEPTATAEDLAEAPAEVEEYEESDDAVEFADEPTDDWQEDTPSTTVIEAVELEKLRAEDALAAGSTWLPLPRDGEKEEAEAVEKVDVLEDDGEPDWEVDEYVDENALPLILPDEVGVGEASPDAEPEPVVTETMAEVYAKQGLFEQAREIYEVLVMQHAGDSRLKARLDELNKRANSAIQETRQSRFSVAVTGGESTVAYLQRMFTFEGEFGVEVPATGITTAAPETPVDFDFEMVPTPLEEAFADDLADAPGEPTVVAANDVTLASVFDGGVSEPASKEKVPGGFDQAPDEPGNEADVSFDEFYGSEPRPSLPGTNGSPDNDDPPDDDARFKDWLKGLKT